MDNANIATPKPDLDGEQAVRARMRTLLELAIRIGRREGLLGKETSVIPGSSPNWKE